MAKITDPYQCDECGAKKNSNGWFLGRPLDGNCIILSKWDENMAEKEGVKHICGIDCAMRFTAKELGKIYLPCCVSDSV